MVVLVVLSNTHVKMDASSGPPSRGQDQGFKQQLLFFLIIRERQLADQFQITNQHQMVRQHIPLYVLYDCCTDFPCTALHCAELHCTALHRTVLFDIAVSPGMAQWLPTSVNSAISRAAAIPRI